MITRRTNFLLGKARDRAHVLIGLAIAVANIDEVIAVIRAVGRSGRCARRTDDARLECGRRGVLLQLVEDSGNRVERRQNPFTEAQAKAILELRLQRLTGLRAREDRRGNERTGDREFHEYLVHSRQPRDKLIASCAAELLDASRHNSPCHAAP